MMAEATREAQSTGDPDEPEKSGDTDADQPDTNGLAQNRTDWAESRTDWAEDRTIMANERTYAGWMRTGLAAVGIGIGFNALFSRLEPAWLPKALASCFIAVGVVIFWLARGKSAGVLSRMSAHRAKPLRAIQINLIAILLSLASLGLLGGLWLM